jgi:hypothetical protein
VDSGPLLETALPLVLFDVVLSIVDASDVVSAVVVVDTAAVVVVPVASTYTDAEFDVTVIAWVKPSCVIALPRAVVIVCGVIAATIADFCVASVPNV